MDLQHGRESNLQDFAPTLDLEADYVREEPDNELAQHAQAHAQFTNPTELNPGNAPDPQTFMPLETPQPPRLTNLAPPTESFELTNVRVSFPVASDTGMNAYMIYRVHFCLNNVESSVVRRFSDFTSLRDFLRAYLPCHYIYPVHRKKTLVM